MTQQPQPLADRLTAHVEYAYSRREGANSLGNYHLVLDQPLHAGRLHRDTHDALCKPGRKFWGLEPRPQAQADCPRCLIAADVRAAAGTAGRPAHPTT